VAFGLLIFTDHSLCCKAKMLQTVEIMEI